MKMLDERVSAMTAAPVAILIQVGIVYTARSARRFEFVSASHKERSSRRCTNSM
jgi:hypothetical protein